MKWNTESQVVIVEPFSEPVGPSATITPSILKNFQLLFTATLTSLIAKQTNPYARQVLGIGGQVSRSRKSCIHWILNSNGNQPTTSIGTLLEA